MGKLKLARSRTRFVGLISALVIAFGLAMYDQIDFGSSNMGVGIAESAKPDGVPGQLLSLTATEAVIRLHYPGLSHLSPSDLIAKQNDVAEGKVVLVDVREAEEFEVSRLAGAIRVDPNSSIEQVLEAVGEVPGRDIVFYCSVGARSSKLARKAVDRLTALGAQSVANLSGGIFRWHNEERSLFDGDGPTELVHQYDNYWGQLIRRRELTAGKALD